MDRDANDEYSALEARFKAISPRLDEGQPLMALLAFGVVTRMAKLAAGDIDPSPMRKSLAASGGPVSLTCEALLRVGFIGHLHVTLASQLTLQRLSADSGADVGALLEWLLAQTKAVRAGEVERARRLATLLRAIGTHELRHYAREEWHASVTRRIAEASVGLIPDAPVDGAAIFEWRVADADRLMGLLAEASIVAIATPLEAAAAVTAFVAVGHDDDAARYIAGVLCHRFGILRRSVRDLDKAMLRQCGALLRLGEYTPAAVCYAEAGDAIPLSAFLQLVDVASVPSGFARASDALPLPRLRGSLEDLRESLGEREDADPVTLLRAWRGFFAEAWSLVERLLGPAPCEYALVALGPLAQGTIGLYGTLAYAIVVDATSMEQATSTERAHFEAAAELMDLLFAGLAGFGTPVPGRVVVRLDGENSPQYCTELLGTPEAVSSHLRAGTNTLLLCALVDHALLVPASSSARVYSRFAACCLAILQEAVPEQPNQRVGELVSLALWGVAVDQAVAVCTRGYRATGRERAGETDSARTAPAEPAMATRFPMLMKVPEMAALFPPYAAAFDAGGVLHAVALLVAAVACGTITHTPGARVERLAFMRGDAGLSARLQALQAAGVIGPRLCRALRSVLELAIKVALRVQREYGYANSVASLDGAEKGHDLAYLTAEEQARWEAMRWAEWEPAVAQLRAGYELLTSPAAPGEPLRSAMRRHLADGTFFADGGLHAALRALGSADVVAMCLRGLAASAQLLHPGALPVLSDFLNLESWKHDPALFLLHYPPAERPEAFKFALKQLRVLSDYLSRAQPNRSLLAYVALYAAVWRHHWAGGRQGVHLLAAADSLFGLRLLRATEEEEAGRARHVTVGERRLRTVDDFLVEESPQSTAEELAVELLGSLLWGHQQCAAAVTLLRLAEPHPEDAPPTRRTVQATLCPANASHLPSIPSSERSERVGACDAEAFGELAVLEMLVCPRGHATDFYVALPDEDEPSSGRPRRCRLQLLASSALSPAARAHHPLSYALSAPLAEAAVHPRVRDALRSLQPGVVMDAWVAGFARSMGALRGLAGDDWAEPAFDIREAAGAVYDRLMEIRSALVEDVSHTYLSLVGRVFGGAVERAYRLAIASPEEERFKYLELCLGKVARWAPARNASTAPSPFKPEDASPAKALDSPRLGRNDSSPKLNRPDSPRVGEATVFPAQPEGPQSFENRGRALAEAMIALRDSGAATALASLVPADRARAVAELECASLNDIRQAAVLNMLCSAGCNLGRLSLREWSSLTVTRLESIVRCNPLLTHVDLTGSQPVSDVGVLGECRFLEVARLAAMPKLTAITRTKRVRAGGAASREYFGSLRELDVRECSKLERVDLPDQLRVFAPGLAARHVAKDPRQKWLSRLVPELGSDEPTLQLEGWRYGEAGIQGLADLLTGNPRVHQLCLSDTDLNGSDALAEALRDNIHITSLSLTGVDGGVDEMANVLADNIAILRLSVQRAPFKEGAAVDSWSRLATAIAANRFLQCVDLSNNELGSGGLEALLQGVAGHPTLTKLCLREVGLVPVLVPALVAACSSGPLTLLDVSGNGAAALDVARAFAAHPSLRVLTTE